MFIGFIGFILTSDVTKTLAIGFYSMTSLYPLCTLPPEDKISNTLKEVIKSNPKGKIPIIIELTGYPGAMAVAQQNDFIPFLQSVGFEIEHTITETGNMITGKVEADKIYEIASNPYVKRVLYDLELKLLNTDSKFNVKMLKDSVPMIRAPEVWAEGYTGQGVVVILIDSGIENNHPWLMRDGKSLVIKEIVTVPGAKDYTHPHGTHCAGIIASQNDVYTGVAPGIEGFIDIISFDHRGRAKLSWILKALEEAYNEAERLKKEGYAVVCSNSWGARPSNDPELNKLRKSALKLAEICPVVFAAGNYGPFPKTIGCPADADNDITEIITVGAVDKKSEIAEFSSRGPDIWGNEHNEPDVVAPGVSIISSVPPASYKSMSGTSMACPHVAGIIALMLSKNPTLNNNNCLKILMDTAKDLGPGGFDYSYGAGLVDAKRAVSITPPQLLPTPILQPIITHLTNIFLGLLIIGVGLFIYSETRNVIPS